MKTRLIMRRWDEFARSIDIEVSFENEEGETKAYKLVTVSQSINIEDFLPELPKVIWSCIGAQVPAVALAMAEALATAVDVAVNMVRLKT